jgi:drug/metabolite transporter (DMT)-like permease
LSLRHAALAILFSLVWSSAFVAGKFALGSLDAATLLTLRFALAALALAPWATRGSARLGLLLGVLNNVVYLGLGFFALTLTRTVVVVAIVSCAPFVTAGLARLTGLERPGLRFYVGAAIAFAGALVVIGFDGQGATLAGVALTAAGVVAFSAATLAYRRYGRDLAPAALNFWQALAGAALFAPLALAFGRFAPALQPAVALDIVFLALGVTIGGMALWLALIRAVGPARASAAHLMNPFFAALLASLLLGAPLRAADYLGAGVIALGLAIALRLNASTGSPRS